MVLNLTIVKRRRPRPTRVCLYRTAPPSSNLTTIAIKRNNGDKQIRAAVAAQISKPRLTNPRSPWMDLCRLDCGNAALGFDFDAFGDEFPNPGLKVLTRKCLHVTLNLPRRPTHSFESTDCMDNSIRFLFGKKNAMDSVVNSLCCSTRAKGKNRTAAGASFGGNYTEIFACCHHQRPGGAV